jgi:hypothetical protein
MLMLAPFLLGVVVIGQLYPADWSEANAQGAQPAAASGTPDLEAASRDARVVSPDVFTDNFEQYAGSWVRFQDHSLHCGQTRDRTKQCFNTDGTAAVLVFFDKLATLEANGWTSPKEFGQYDRSLACPNPLFYFSGAVPTTNPHAVGVSVETLYCASPH